MTLYQIQQQQSTMEREFNTCELEQLPYEKLFEIAEEKFNELDYEEAEIYYEAAYKKKPSEDMIVLCYSHILKQNQKEQQAKQILQNSLSTNPHGTYKRYFELGELHHGEQSIAIFQKGISIALNCLQNPFLNLAPASQIKRDIAQAFASIAEICMTDLSNIPYEQVEAKCISVLEKGKEIDPSCMDIHLQAANCLIEKSQNQKAKHQLMMIKQAIFTEKQEYEDELVLQCSKYFMEISEYQSSIDVLEKLNESQNNSPEIVYLLAFCAFKMNNIQLCKDYIAEYPEGQTDDPEVAEAMAELKHQLQKNKNKGNHDETQQGCMDDEDEWIDVEDDGDYQ